MGVCRGWPAQARRSCIQPRQSLHIGAGTTNKNILLLIKAFAHLHKATELPLYLMVKTLTALYPVGGEVVRDAMITAINETGMPESAIVWLDDTYSMEFLGTMYRCSNTYVSPYQSEGFDMPVLESLASGLPVIVSKGGPTDDFTKSSFARYVDSEIVTRYEDKSGQITDISSGDAEAIQNLPKTSKPVRRGLRVNIQSLYDQMFFVVKDHYEIGAKWLKPASKKASAFAKKRYQWSNVTSTLIKSLTDKGSEKFSHLGEL